MRHLLYLLMPIFLLCTEVQLAARDLRNRPKEPVDIEGNKVQLADKERKRLDNGKNLLKKGQCPEIVQEFKNYSFEAIEHSQEDLVEVHQLLGICYVQLEDLEKARNEIQSLIYLDPDYTFDPLTTPPQVQEIFQELLLDYKEKLQEFKKLRQRQKQKTKRIKKTKSFVDTDRKWPIKFAPFGIAQWHNQQNVKAIIFLFLQSMPLGINVATYWALQVVRDGPYQIAKLKQDDPERQLFIERILFTTHFFALSMFFVIYGIQVADAFLFEDE